MQQWVLRVGGRLSSSCLDYGAKHSILLPRQSHVSKFHAHRKVGHLDRNSMVAHLRQIYWIIGVHVLTRGVIWGCVTCRKYNSKALAKMMDFMEPIEVKLKRSKVKRWVVIFTCKACRTVHIEICTSLDTASCINMVNLFVCRRDQVRIIRGILKLEPKTFKCFRGVFSAHASYEY